MAARDGLGPGPEVARVVAGIEQKFGVGALQRHAMTRSNSAR
jgi:hypothetical protein